MGDCKLDGKAADKGSTRDNAVHGHPLSNSEPESGRTGSQRRETVPKLAMNLPAGECRAQRERLGWSLQDLSSRSGFPVATLVEFEGGQRTLGLSAQVALQRALRKGSRAIRP